MKTAQNLIDFIIENEIADVENGRIHINDNELSFDTKENKFSIKNLASTEHKRIFDLTTFENHSVVMLLISLFKRGYSAKNISLEKRWASGRTTSDYLDVMLKNPETNDIIMFEVKTYDELSRFYSDTSKQDKMVQLISYIMHQPKNVKIATFYAYDFDTKKPYFNNIFCEEILNEATDSDDFYTRWNKVFDHSNFIKQNPLWNTTRQIKKYSDLQEITDRDTKNLYSQFLTILRLNSISDKPNAFIKMINLLLCKIADETRMDTDFNIINQYNEEHTIHGLKFQFIDKTDTPESFMKRLNDLYKEGMSKYLGKDIVEYTDSDVNIILNGNNTPQIMEMINDLRLKKEQNFAFIEVYDNDTFIENFYVVREIVKLLEGFKFKYDKKQVFLGDFFEDLLNTSLKQEAGQFFTPYPLVDFMVKSIGIDWVINNKIQNQEKDFVPSIIDYACGAGHFLISAMAEIQEIISRKTEEDFLTKDQKNKFNSYKNSPYAFVSRDKIIGIEKDYRLAKTSKIATFLNGDGDAAIISGDGINKFSAKEYTNTILYSEASSINKFDFVISNPPYSVAGFMQAFKKNKIDKNSGTFSLLTQNLNNKSSDIETYFVERTYQLLKNNGRAAIILPQSILSQDKYLPMRKFLLKNFIIKSMLLTADITFLGTTTSPVVLFLEKKATNNLDYNILISMSPKYLTPNTTGLKRKEEDFLGYSFSSNRSKSGISIKQNSVLLDELMPITKSFINSGCCGDNRNTKVVKLKDILLNSTDAYIGDIYPKYKRALGNPLNKYCKINSRSEQDVTNPVYIEIGNLSNQQSTKNKKSNRFCKKGDILISSITPRRDQIVIAQNDFMLTSAIYVLSDFESDNMRDRVFNALREDQALEQMNALLDGFKITYAKISDKNLYNNVFIRI